MCVCTAGSHCFWRPHARQAEGEGEMSCFRTGCQGAALEVCGVCSLGVCGSHAHTHTHTNRQIYEKKESEQIAVLEKEAGNYARWLLPCNWSEQTGKSWNGNGNLIRARPFVAKDMWPALCTTRYTHTQLMCTKRELQWGEVVGGPPQLPGSIASRIAAVDPVMQKIVQVADVDTNYIY